MKERGKKRERERESACISNIYNTTLQLERARKRGRERESENKKR